jgi:ATP/ADP translocase
MAMQPVRGSAVAIRHRNLEPSIAQSETDPSKHETRHQFLPADVLFWLSVFAILLQFFLTGNVLRTMGIDVNMRVHPASVLVLLCAIYALLKGVVPFHQRCRNSACCCLCSVSLCWRCTLSTSTE